MMGPQRGNFSKDVSWGDLGSAIEKACIDSNLEQPEDRKMPAKKMPPKNSNHQENDNHHLSSSNPRFSMKKQVEKNHDRLQSSNDQGKNHFRRHASGESNVSWRDLTESIEQAKLDSSLNDGNYEAGDLEGSAGEDDENTHTSRKKESMFQSFRYLDDALETATRNSIASAEAEKRAASENFRGTSSKGETLFESFRNLDDAMAQALKNSLMDSVGGVGREDSLMSYNSNACGKPKMFASMEEVEEDTALEDMSLSHRDSVDGSFKSSMGSHQSGGLNASSRSKQSNAGVDASNTSRGTHCSSITAVTDNSENDLLLVQQQLQNFTWGQENDQVCDSSDDENMTASKQSPNRKLTRCVSVDMSSREVTRRSLHRNSSMSEGNPPSNDAAPKVTSQLKHHGSKDSAEQGHHHSSKSSSKGLKYKLHRRLSRSMGDQDNQYTSKIDHPPSSSRRPASMSQAHAAELDTSEFEGVDDNHASRRHFGHRDRGLTVRLESSAPNIKKKKKKGRKHDAPLSSSASSTASQSHPQSIGDHDVRHTNSPATDTVPHQLDSNTVTRSATNNLDDASRLHYGDLSRHGSIMMNLEAPPTATKKKFGLKNMFGGRHNTKP